LGFFALFPGSLDAKNGKKRRNWDVASIPKNNAIDRNKQWGINLRIYPNSPAQVT